MKNKIAIIFLIVISVVLYVMTMRGFLGNLTTADELTPKTTVGQPFESSHERASYALMVSFLQDHSLSLSKAWADFGSPDVGFNSGKFYSFFPPGVSFSIMPLYLLGQKFGFSQLASFFTIALFAIGAMVFLFLISRNIFRLSSLNSVLVALVFAFATTSWSYAITIYQHLPAAFFLVSSFYFVWKYKTAAKRQWLWATLVWLVYGTSIFFDYPNALILLPVMFYFLFSSFNFNRIDEKLTIKFRSVILVTFIVFLAVAGLHMYYNQVVYGSWKQIGQSNKFQRYRIGDYEQIIHPRADFEAAPTATTSSQIFKEDLIVNGGFTLLFGPDKGIFVFSPILLLALLGIFEIRKKLNMEYGVLIALLITNLLIYASFGDPWGGWAYGPRYLIPSMAILSIFSVIWLQQNAFRILRKVVFFLLFGYSAAIALLGVLTTNVVPPKIEAIPLKLPYYNFLLNYHLILNGTTSNFIYKTYLASRFSLLNYFFLIYGIIIFIVLLILTLPQKNHDN